MKIKLKTIRRKHNVTQEELANKLGVTKGYISRVETGTKHITLDLACEIADYLGVSLDEIAGRKKKQSPDEQTANAVPAAK